MVVAQLCPTVCNPMSSKRTRFLCPWDFPGKNTGVWPFPSPRDLPHPGVEPGSSAFQGVSLPTEPTGKHVLNRMI